MSESSGFMPSLPIQEFEGHMPNPAKTDQEAPQKEEVQQPEPEWERDETLMSPPHPMGQLEAQSVVRSLVEGLKKLIGIKPAQTSKLV